MAVPPIDEAEFVERFDLIFNMNRPRLVTSPPIRRRNWSRCIAVSAVRCGIQLKVHNR